MPLLTGLVVAGTGVEVRGALVIVICFWVEGVRVFLSALVPFRCSIDKLCRSEGRFGQGQELTAEFELDPLEERQRIQRGKTERN